MSAITRRAHPIEDGGDRPQVAESDIERAEGGDDDEIRQDENPAAGPRAPEAASKIGNINADLDSERPGERLTDRDRLSHLRLADPAAVVDQLALHLADEGDRSAKAEQAEAEEVEHEFAHRAL